MNCNIYYHLRTVLIHKHEVFKAMCKCGMPIRGLLHDMSKFSPAEFITSVKYYQGTQSPINAERKDKGYSMVWLHHKAHNKHHTQYWVDLTNGNIIPVEMPWKYVVEYICDGIAAGKTYARNKGTEWTDDNPLRHFNRADNSSIIHPSTRAKIRFYYTEIAERGWERVAKDIRHKGDYFNG